MLITHSFPLLDKHITLFQVSFHYQLILLLIAAADNQVIFWTDKPQELFKPVGLPCFLYSSRCFDFFKSFFCFSFRWFQRLQTKEKASQRTERKRCHRYIERGVHVSY